ncbi:MAG: hypothetical protein LLF94_12115, partial [Chlamydiales bacterium]|nr:hypothetical protein [Chlamydiales bacterium]
NSSRLHREIYEIYLYLHESASGKSMDKSIHKDGEYFAKLQDWTGYLFHTGHSVVEPLVDAFIVHEQLGLYDETSLEPIPQGDDIPPILRAQIELLALIFPKIPYKYYMEFPLVKKTVQRLNIAPKRFCDIATEVSKMPRMPGRPKKNILTQYEQCHPNLKSWFDHISKKIGPKNKSPK